MCPLRVQRDRNSHSTGSEINSNAVNALSASASVKRLFSLFESIIGELPRTRLLRALGRAYDSSDRNAKLADPFKHRQNLSAIGCRDRPGQPELLNCAAGAAGILCSE